jgi:hypothetical protein
MHRAQIRVTGAGCGRSIMPTSVRRLAAMCLQLVLGAGH